jgi:hypothetical protein
MVDVKKFFAIFLRILPILCGFFAKFMRIFPILCVFANFLRILPNFCETSGDFLQKTILFRKCSKKSQFLC